MSLKSINPFTGETLAESEEESAAGTDKILENSKNAFSGWRLSGFDRRRSRMLKVAKVLRSKADELARTVTLEMGKPVRESREEIEKCAWVCEYYAENARRFLRSEPAQSDASESYVAYEPLGTILGIMPWNFPFWQAFRFAVPAIMAGNTVVMKHASNVQLSALNIQNVFLEAGFPDSVYCNLAVSSGKMEPIIRDERIAAISLTGSESAGRIVAAVAGSVLKKCVLELGGSNPFIVLDDANIQKAVETGIKSRFQNAGQSCIAAKRFIVDRKISHEFTDLFLEAVRKIRKGDPLKEETEIGPLSSIAQAEIVEDQVRRSVSMGAEIIEGGTKENAFFAPTIVTNVTKGMPLFDEEVFGPVAPIIVAADLEEAVTLAGQTSFGLGVTIFTKDLCKAAVMVPRFRDGSVFVNGLVKSDPRLPFGGTGNSGYGRELSVNGIREFVNVKTVWVKRL